MPSLRDACAAMLVCVTLLGTTRAARPSGKLPSVEQRRAVCVRGPGTELLRAHDGTSSDDGKPAEKQPANVHEGAQEKPLAQGALVAKLGGQSLLGEPLAIISDGKTVLTKDENSACVWETATGRLLRRFSFAPRTIGNEMSAGGSSEGKRLLSLLFGRGIDVQVWDLEKGQPAKTSPIKFKVHAFGSPPATFVPEGDRVAWIDQEDDAIVFWDLKTGKCETLKMTAPGEDYFPARGGQLAFTRDGKKMFLAGKAADPRVASDAQAALQRLGATR